ncbi:hypothetical protein [Armatimonas sp.]|uniref:hypothetical protein n=1 Tax=Armatimonas sp. TaxID=1872638 RepID=UPI0037508581
MMSFYIRRDRLWALLTAIFVTGLVFGFLGRERAIASERLSYQSSILAKIARDAMLYRATPQRIADKVKTELKTSVDFGFSHQNAQEAVVVMPDETGFLGLGGRWILHLQVGNDGRCEQAWLEMQPVGCP